MAQATDNRTIVPRSVGRYLAQVAIVSAAQFGAGRLGDVLQTINNGGIGPVWPASGIALGALLLWGYSVWPGIAAGAFLLASLSPLPHRAAAVYAAGTTLAALLAAFLLRRIAKFDHSLSHLRDALGLVVLGAFGSSVVSASIGVSALYAAHIRGWSGFGSAWLIYWLGDSTGVLLITPVMLTFPDLLRIRSWFRIPEFVAGLFLLTVVCFIIFGDLPLIPIRLHILAFAVLPFVIGAAIRFGVSGAGLATLLIALIATIETAFGSGPFATNTPLMNAVLLDVFFGVVSVTGLTLAAVCEERERAEREREQLAREQAAMEARLRLATIVESSDDAIISKDLDGVIVSWNAAAQHIFAFTEAEAVGQPITILIPPELWDEENKILQRLRAGGRIEHLETIRVAKTGKRVDVSLTISPIKDAAGRVVGASKIARDITERKRADEALRKSEERFQLATQAGRMFAYEWDATTDVVGRSAESAQILGINEAAHITGEQVLTMVHPHDRERLMVAIAALSPEEPYLQISYRMVRPDGTVIWVERNSRAHFDEQGRMLRIIGMVADITERKRVEEALKKSEEKFSKAFRESPMALTLTSAKDHRYLDVNETFEQLTGWLRDEVIGRTPFDIGIWVDPSQRVEFVKQLLSGDVIRNLEVRYRCKDGTERFGLGSAELIEIANEPCILSVIADISDRKRAEKALSGMSRKLIEAQEQERTRIARDLHDDVAQRLALLAIELERVQQNLPDSVSELCTRIDTIRKQSAQISIDVQTMSHELHSSKLDYLGIVAAMKGFCKEFGEQQKVEIDFRSHDLPTPLSPEISLCLFRVLQEALHNAAKHSGVAHFEVQLWGTSDEIHLAVNDLGGGFDTETAMHGSGLGLTSMQERLRFVNGELSINSQLERGTTVHARIPFSSSSDSARAAG